MKILWELEKFTKTQIFRNIHVNIPIFHNKSNRNFFWRSRCNQMVTSSNDDENILWELNRQSKCTPKLRFDATLLQSLNNKNIFKKISIKIPNSQPFHHLCQTIDFPTFLVMIPSFA
jgi:hypothetical protein